ncbi:MAG: PHP domain-containing protein [Acidimicrobiia bacterium]
MDALARHPHLREPKPEGWVRVDLHSHTMWSGDATTTPEELEAAVTAAGLDVLCITDHATTAGAEKLRDSLPCSVVIGEEVRCGEGELIGLFLTERIPPGLSAREVAGAIREQGGVVYVPHPFDPLRKCLAEPTLIELADEGLLDAIEAFNAKVSLQSLNRRAAEFADERALPVGAGSDAHEPGAFGAAIVDMPAFGDRESFLDALRVARIAGHHYDAPRQWRPRVVPSTKNLP